MGDSLRTLGLTLAAIWKNVVVSSSSRFTWEAPSADFARDLGHWSLLRRHVVSHVRLHLGRERLLGLRLGNITGLRRVDCRLIFLHLLALYLTSLASLLGLLLSFLWLLFVVLRLKSIGWFWRTETTQVGSFLVLACAICRLVARCV